MKKVTKINNFVSTLLILVISIASIGFAAPMGTAFTYQGRLNDNGNPADGLYDLQFKLYDQIGGNNQFGNSLIKDEVDVIDGYFTVNLDFVNDPNVFDGDARWLQIGVRPGASTGAFTTLTPRQEVTPTPYAMHTRGIFVDDNGNVGIGTTNPLLKLHIAGADMASVLVHETTNNVAGQLMADTGTVSLSSAFDHPIRFMINDTMKVIIEPSGNVGIGTASPAAKLDVVGTVNATAFTGDGSALTNLPVTVETDPTVLTSVKDGVSWSELSDIPADIADGDDIGGADADWTINGNNMYTDAAITGNVGIGTTNPMAKLSVGGGSPAGAGVYGTGNTYGVYGSSTNYGLYGFGDIGVAGQGSTWGVSGVDTSTSSYGRLGYDTHGVYSFGTTYGVHSTTNNPSGYAGYFIGGQNYFQGSVGIGITTPKNKLDVVGAVAIGATYSGIWTAPANGMIIEGNVGIGTTDPAAKLTVDGAILRQGSTMYGTVAVTHINLGTGSRTGAIGENYAYATVTGGYDNRAAEDYTTVSGGYNNDATGYSATVGGGIDNIASGGFGTIAGGSNNTTGSSSTVAGGFSNHATGDNATVSGGSTNSASGSHATIAGGSGNAAPGDYTFAAGHRAKANHQGTFVWADDATTSEFASTGDNQFLIRAAGGVGINTTTTFGIDLVVNGSAAKPGGGSWSIYSDRRLKKNIQPMTGTLDRMLRLKGVTFEYSKPEHFSYVQGQQIGMIAQDIEKVFPDWISEHGQYKAVTFSGFEALTVESLRELRQEKDAEIAELKNENIKIKKQLAQMQQVLTQLAAQQKGAI